MRLFTLFSLAGLVGAFFAPGFLAYAETAGSSFVPLTTLPGLSDVASANNVAAFLNQLYKLSIGAAAVLAVLQITRAGFMYMTEESISEKKEARGIMVMSVLGLILVLSPAVVFGVIDPRILELDLNVSRLQGTTTTTTTTTGTGTGTGTGTTQTTGTGTGTTQTTDPEPSAGKNYVFQAPQGKYISVVGAPAFRNGDPNDDCYFMDARSWNTQETCAGWIGDVESAVHQDNPEVQVTRYRDCVVGDGTEQTISVSTDRDFCALPE